MRGRQLVVALVALLAFGLLWWAEGGVTSEPGSGERPTTSTGSTPDEMPVVTVADLPAEARDVIDRIDAGGPFKYPADDGGTFGNREGLLPDRPNGYYEEYTVETAPRERGPWRIVTGDEADEVYWTEDHYRSFSRIEDHGIEDLE